LHAVKIYLIVVPNHSFHCYYSHGSDVTIKEEIKLWKESILYSIFKISFLSFHVRKNASLVWILTCACEKPESRVLFTLIEQFWFFGLSIELIVIIDSVRLLVTPILFDNPIVVCIVVFERVTFFDVEN
jgi:hypothetical protein